MFVRAELVLERSTCRGSWGLATRVMNTVTMVYLLVIPIEVHTTILTTFKRSLRVL